MGIIAVKFIVSGRVQGVGYRWFVLNAAQGLDIKGTVKNNVDGSVEVIAQSTPANIENMKLQLSKGPSFSRIDTIKESSQNANNNLIEFKIIY